MGTAKESKPIWWINSKKHNYCFWTLLLDTSDEQGVMRRSTLKEVTKLLGMNNTKAHFVIKEAYEELERALRASSAEDLLEEDT